MLGLFKRREWVPEPLAELHGSYEHLNVTVRNLPCRRDAKSGTRKYAYSDFGNDFLMALHEQLGDFERLCAKLKAGASVHAFIKLPSYSPIVVEVSGTPGSSRRQFDSDLSDALIAAFKSVQLKP